MEKTINSKKGKKKEELQATTETNVEDLSLEEVQENEGEISTENDEQEKGTSLDLLWNNVFRELEHWAKHADFRDEIFLKEANYFAAAIKRNQGNIKEVTEQFNKELMKWERTAREEFLMSTTTLQHVFPKVSYEEMNQQIDKIQQKTVSILNAPIQVIANNQLMDQYLNMIDQYIELRRKGRKQYIKTVKQAANLIYETQKGVVDIITGQIKSFMFPLNKYLEKTED